MPALDALTFKAQLVEDARHSMAWRGLLGGMADSMRGEWTRAEKARMKAHGKGLPLPVHGFTGTGQQLTDQLVRAVDMAETYYVAPTMHALVTAAAESLPEDTVVQAQDFPSPQGFVTIPGGITVVDMRGKLVATDAIVWDTYGGQVHLTYLVDKYNPTDRAMNWLGDDAAAAEAFDGLPRLTPWHFLSLEFGKPLPRSMGLFNMTVPPEIADQMSFHHTKDGKLAASWPKGYDLNPEPTRNPDAVAAWLLAAVKLMRQPLVSLTPLPIDRAGRRRLGRVKMANTNATVIQLRQRSGQYNTESGREYSHRFLRRGHWRNQWYGSGATRRQETIYIHLTLVGDPSLPLIVRDHVNALIR